MLGTETVVPKQERAFDDNNDPIEPPAGTTSSIPGCLVEPLNTLDSTIDITRSDRSGTATRIRVFLPTITAGVAADKIFTIAGRPGAFRVIGDPVPHISDEDPELSGYAVLAESVRG